MNNTFPPNLEACLQETEQRRVNKRVPKPVPEPPPYTAPTLSISGGAVLTNAIMTQTQTYVIESVVADMKQKQGFVTASPIEKEWLHRYDMMQRAKSNKGR